MEDIKIFKNFILEKECNDWISIAPKFNGSFDFQYCTIDITNYTVVDGVKNFLEKSCNCKLTCSQAQIQLWPIGSKSILHTHIKGGRESTDYNSLIYLNSDFDGGEFITNNLIIKPEPGMLTFFNGHQIYHGVNKVKNKHRYTLIFWWQNTIFY